MPAIKPHWFHILLSLADQDLHGLAIRDQVLERTGGQVHLWPAMLYGSLQKLSDLDLIEETEPPPGFEVGGGTPRLYALTEAGRVALAEEVGKMESYVAVARAKRVGEA